MAPSRIPREIQQRIRAEARNQCGYCQSQQAYIPAPLEIEHIIPTAKDGSDDEDNLWLACRLCNSYKGTQTHTHDPVTGRRVRLFNPRKQSWQRHFRWNDDGTHVIGRTQVGRGTVLALQLNDPIAVEVRRNWVKVGWHPPRE